MNAIVIAADTKTDIKIFADIAQRIGIKAKILTDEQILDIGLLNAMEEGKKSKFVSKESVMKKLTKNGN